MRSNLIYIYGCVRLCRYVVVLCAMVFFFLHPFAVWLNQMWINHFLTHSLTFDFNMNRRHEKNTQQNNESHNYCRSHAANRIFCRKWQLHGRMGMAHQCTSTYVEILESQPLLFHACARAPVLKKTGNEIACIIILYQYYSQPEEWRSCTHRWMLDGCWRTLEGME